jgi:hypothetical protein
VAIEAGADRAHTDALVVGKRKAGQVVDISV